jgi:hypothetical protein
MPDRSGAGNYAGGPAVRGSSVCRMHGANGGALPGNSNAWRHGLYLRPCAKVSSTSASSLSFISRGHSTMTPLQRGFEVGIPTIYGIAGGERESGCAMARFIGAPRAPPSPQAGVRTAMERNDPVETASRAPRPA